MSKYKIVKSSYELMRPHLKSFTLIRCQAVLQWWNPVSWFWYAIEHTAMVFKDANGNDWVWESTQRKIEGTDKNGARLTPFKQWLDEYPGHVYLRMTHIEPAFTVTAQALLETYIADNRELVYPDLKTRRGRWYLIKSAWDSKIFKKASTNVEQAWWRFCTDLVAATFRACMLAVFACASSEFEPDDMQPGEKFEDYLINCKADNFEYQIK